MTTEDHEENGKAARFEGLDAGGGCEDVQESKCPTNETICRAFSPGFRGDPRPGALPS